MTDNTRIQGMQFEINDLKKQLLTNMDEMNRFFFEMQEQQRRSMEETGRMFASLILKPEANRQQNNVSQVEKESFYQHNHYSSERFGRFLRFEIPRFQGSDLKGWLLKCEQFFIVNSIPANDKVRLVAAQLEGQALQWHRIYLKGRLTRELPRWKDYVFALHNRFGTGVGFDCLEDSMDELIVLEQSGGVQDYINDFVKLLKLLDVREDVVINCFVRGLRDDIEVEVRMGEPKTLQKAFNLAKLHEQLLSLTTGRYSSTQPTQTPPLLSVPSNPKGTYLGILHVVKPPNEFQPQVQELSGKVQIPNKPFRLTFPIKMNENQTEDLDHGNDQNIRVDCKCSKEHIFAWIGNVKEVEEDELGQLVECKVVKEEDEIGQLVECNVVKEEETEQETNFQISIDAVAGSWDGKRVKAACSFNFALGQHMRQEPNEKEFLKQEEWKWWLADIDGLIMEPKSFKNRAKEYCSALRERHHTYEYHVFKGFFHLRQRQQNFFFHA